MQAAYFDRDDVALPGFAKRFRENSDEERGHAMKLIEYQNMRGGKVVFKVSPFFETRTCFDHSGLIRKARKQKSTERNEKYCCPSRESTQGLWFAGPA